MTTAQKTLVACVVLVAIILVNCGLAIKAHGWPALPQSAEFWSAMTGAVVTAEASFAELGVSFTQ
jgi:hypothetical protein